MASDSNLKIEQMYSIINRIGDGIEGYQATKIYEDPLKIVKDRQILKIKKGQKNGKYVTKRGNYLDEEVSIYKTHPGPDKYPISMQWPQLRKLKVHHQDRTTYLDQIFKLAKRDRKPAPGHYKITKSFEEQQKQKKILASKKIVVEDRFTFLDGIQHSSSLTPGAGNYNPRKRAKTEISHLKITPQDWRKKHEQQQKKRKYKSPSAVSYKPMPADYSLFETLNIQKKKKKDIFSRTVRFKTMPPGIKIGPATYSIMQTWRGKSHQKIERHGIEVLSTKPMNQTIYHN